MNLYYDGVQMGASLRDAYSGCRYHFLEFRRTAVDRLAALGSPLNGAIEFVPFEGADDFFVVKSLGLALKFRFRIHWPYSQPIAGGVIEVHELLDGDELRRVGDVLFDQNGLVSEPFQGGRQEVPRLSDSAASIVLSAFRAAVVNLPPATA